MTATTTPDQRPVGLRVLIYVGVVVLLLLGVLLLVAGAASLDTGTGQVELCLGLLLLFSAAGGLARELAERAHDRQPPRPTLTTLDGEAALHLPRSPWRGRVSSGTLLGFAAVCLLGAVLSEGRGHHGWLVVLVVLALVLTWAARPWALRNGAGGLWLTPTRLHHAHDDLSWVLPWTDVTGTVPREPLPVLVRPGTTPELKRSRVLVRRRVPAERDGVLLVETRYLAGGAPLAALLIDRALTDDSFCAALGTDTSFLDGA